MYFLKLPPVAAGRLRFSTSPIARIKVAVLGASGGIGHPLTLLLKLSDVVSRLSLYDITHAYGDATDLGHINTASSTEGFDGKENIGKILEGSEVVIIPAGIPRKPGMSRLDLFQTNANATVELVEACAQHCPKAVIAIITNPLNAVVPVAAEILKKKGVYDPRRLFGVTTLDMVRASTFCAKLKGLNPASVYIPVIGGHSGSTMVPLLSKVRPKVELTEEEIVMLTKKIQLAGEEVVKAKGGSGSATLSMAYAAARFLFSICRGLKGEPRVIECSYVESDIMDTKYFSSPLVLGKEGVEEILPLPKLSKYENELLTMALEELKKNIAKAEKFIRK